MSLLLLFRNRQRGGGSSPPIASRSRRPPVPVVRPWLKRPQPEPVGRRIRWAGELVFDASVELSSRVRRNRTLTVACDAEADISGLWTLHPPRRITGSMEARTSAVFLHSWQRHDAVRFQVALEERLLELGVNPIGEALDVPGELQDTDYSCGAAAMVMVCRYFGVEPDTESEAIRMLGTSPADGTDADMISAVADLHGLVAEPRHGMTIDDLREATDEGKPVIVAFQYLEDPAHGWENGHYAVVIGIEDGKVILQDPSLGEVSVPEADFLERWHDVDADGERYVNFGVIFSRPAPYVLEAQAPSAPPGSDIGLGGRPGKDVQRLLDAALREGQDVLHDIVLRATKRLLLHGGAYTARFLNDTERAELTALLASASATANLLARSLLRDYAERVETSEGLVRPSLLNAVLEAGPVEPLPPERALDYFLRLMPELGVDPQRFGFDLRRHAFTLAVATETRLLNRVQKEIAANLASGQSTMDLARNLDGILSAAGVSSANPQYSEQVVRTNLMDSYNQGWQDEMSDPDIGEMFPVWQYSNPHDSRSRPEHAARDGNYYPASASFVSVRGEDIAEAANCRCVPIAVSKFEWRRLKAQGARIADGYADVSTTDVPASEPRQPEPVQQPQAVPVAQPATPVAAVPQLPPPPVPQQASQSNATVKYKFGSDGEKTKEIIRSLLGSPDRQQIASLVGAPDTARVVVDKTKRGNNVEVIVKHQDFTAIRTIGKDRSGKLYIRNDDFFMKDSAQGKGLGTEVFGKQIENAQKQGFSYIQCHAAKDNPEDKKKPHNGYYTWARLGYDQSLTDSKGISSEDAKAYARARKAFPKAKTVLDIMATPEGRDWWKKNGADMYNAKFDLTPGSRSMKVLEAYRAERSKQGK